MPKTAKTLDEKGLLASTGVVIADTKHITGEPDAPLVGIFLYNVVDKRLRGYMVIMRRTGGMRVPLFSTGQPFTHARANPMSIALDKVGKGKRFQKISVSYTDLLPKAW